MRVTCNTVDDFIKCLESDPHVFQNVVRVNIYRRPEEGKRYESIKFDVVLQASAIVFADEESQYLLEFGMDCGVDIEDADPEFKGSAKAEEVQMQIRRVADRFGWKILPGVINL